MKQIYRIVSDISQQQALRETSFCVKVINGICQTYTGVFKEWEPCTGICEIHASYIGLSLIADHLYPGDTVFIHSDTTCSNSLKSNGKTIALKNLIQELWAMNVHVVFDGVKKNASNKYQHNALLHYQDCHKLAGSKLKARWKLHTSINKNFAYPDSYLWNAIKN